MSVEKGAATISALAIFVGVLFTTRSRGVAVQLSSCLFVCSLVATTLTMRELMGQSLQFYFPGYTTALHTCSVWLTCLVYWVAQGDVGKCSPASIGSVRRYVTSIVPIACCMPASIICANSGLMFIGAGLNSIIGALSPVTTALLSYGMGRYVSQAEFVGLAVAFAGIGLFSVSEIVLRPSPSEGDRTRIIGISLSLVAVFLRSAKVVFQDMLLNVSAYLRSSEPDGVQSLSAMHAWALQAPVMVLVSLAYATCTESHSEALAKASEPRVAIALVMSAVFATMLNITGMIVIKQLGASLMQIIGKLNAVVIVPISFAFFGENFSLLTLAGGATVLLGIVIFERAGSAKAKDETAPFRV